MIGSCNDNNDDDDGNYDKNDDNDDEKKINIGLSIPIVILSTCMCISSYFK